MKISKEKLKDVILTVSQIGGTLKFMCVLLKYLQTPEEWYNFYYGSGVIDICIYNTYDNPYSILDRSKISNDNIDAIVDDVYEYLISDVYPLIKQALINIGEGGEFETLKYFGRNKELFIKFQNELLKLSQND